MLAALEPELIPDEDGVERVGWYLSQWLATVPSKGEWTSNYAQLARKGEGRECKQNTVLDDICVMVAMGMHVSYFHRRYFYPRISSIQLKLP